MDSEKVIKRDGEYVLHTYNRNPIVLEKGHGLRAAGPEGQQYLDFTSGIGVNSLGYCDLDWAEAVSEQAHKLQHTSNLYYTAPCGKLAKKLCKRTGMSKVFFGNSGAEANEGAIKAARKYSVDHYRKDRTTVITLVNSFHGRTIATLTATGQEVFHNYFGPFNEGFQYVPAGDIEALRELVDRHTCAVMMELIQGEGGVLPADTAFLQGLRKLCDRHGALLIFDEVQTGVGRTGALYAYMEYGVTPDILTSAKALGGGFPIGAMLTTDRFAPAFSAGTHGTTWGGNPLASAVAGTVLALINTPEVLDGVALRHHWFIEGLQEINARFPLFSEIRGRGLLIGCVMDQAFAGQAKRLTSYAAEEGLMALIAGSEVVRFAPSLIIPEADVREGLARFAHAAERLAAATGSDAR